MPRLFLFPLTMLVLIATAIAMLASAMILPMPHATEFSISVGNDGTDVVERFYAAVNETIATGNPTALRQVVNPSFTDDNPLPGLNPGRAGLEAYLDTLHAANPGLRLVPAVLSAGSREIVTQVEVRHDPQVTPQPAAFGEQQAVWSPIEVLRVANGVVVGRWGQTDGLVFARPLAAAALELQAPTPRVIGLARVTQAPGTRWDAPRVAGPRLLFLEQGVLDVQAVPGSAMSAAPGAASSAIVSNADWVGPPTRSTLITGQTWNAPAGALTSTMNAGSAESRVLVVTFTEPQIPNVAAPAARSLPAGVAVQVLAGDLATGVASGPVSVALQRIALTPHAGLNLSSSDGPVLVAVETGQIAAAAWGTVWVRRSRDGMSVASQAAVLTSQNGLLLQSGGVLTLRNRERSSTQVLVLAVQQTGADHDRGP